MEALEQAQQGADEASAEVAAARARVAELEAEARQLRPARAHALELQERLADREQKLEKLRAEVRPSVPTKYLPEGHEVICLCFGPCLRP